MRARKGPHCATKLNCAYGNMTNLIKPNVGSVVRVVTRWVDEYINATSKWCDIVYEGVVVRSNAWDQPNTFKMQVNNPTFPNPIIPLNRVHELEFLSGAGSAVSAGIKSITVNGSKGNTYTVTMVNGRAMCSCPGFQFRKQCKHLQLIA